MTRRRWVQLGFATAAFAAGAAATGGGALLLDSLLPPPTGLKATVSSSLMYTAFPTAQWWNDKANTSVRVGDFALWAGATAVWRGLFDSSGALVPGTGYPVLVLRVPRVDTYYSLPNPSPWTLTEGLQLFYDDPSRDLRIVAVFDRCTHLCCYPGWHIVSSTLIPRDYSVPPPTYDVYQQDPIYCICHDAQFDPLLLIADTNPHNGVQFPGMQVVRAPAPFALPLVPLRAVNDVLEGGMLDSRWYDYC